jgi:hypothetical protein
MEIADDSEIHTAMLTGAVQVTVFMLVTENEKDDDGLYNFNKGRRKKKTTSHHQNG